MALWSGTQTTSGSVNATSSSVDLYICEPNADPANTGCGPDDSDADETIFEGTENLLPGSIVWAPVRLRNVGSSALDITGFDASVEKVSDPGNDCPQRPTATPRMLGKWWVNPNDHKYHYGCSPGAGNDNHYYGQTYELPTFYGTTMNGAVKQDDCPNSSEYGVHIATGDYEDMAVEVRLPLNELPSCEDVVWSITVSWYVRATAY